MKCISVLFFTDYSTMMTQRKIGFHVSENRKVFLRIPLNGRHGFFIFAHFYIYVTFLFCKYTSGKQQAFLLHDVTYGCQCRSFPSLVMYTVGSIQ